MYRWLHRSHMPAILKILLYILLTLTCIYWIIMLTYKLLSIIRICMHFISEKRNWWTFVVVLVIIGISALLLGQFYFGLDPVGKVAQWFVERWSEFRSTLGNKIINS